MALIVVVTTLCFWWLFLLKVNSGDGIFLRGGCKTQLISFMLLRLVWLWFDSISMLLVRFDQAGTMWVLVCCYELGC